MSDNLRRIVIRGGIPVSADHIETANRTDADAPDSAEVEALKEQAALDATALNKAQKDIVKLKAELKGAKDVLSKAVKERDAALKDLEAAKKEANGDTAPDKTGGKTDGDGDAAPDKTGGKTDGDGDAAPDKTGGKTDGDGGDALKL